ncbi:hypothetical protein [Piscinibacter koreensis]|uniref:Uncharacterized protein n=1 Tax=Piscinibacter koreensis TaxID=2742824 RepID=A0A7Y6NP39_9BURK|nr:hypothetical protein [Schlegelella koreensis]NUZ06762.1 hypothetical protein [Schlegelella koreensis]
MRAGLPASDLLAWPALLLAPLLALGYQSIVYAMVWPACEAQSSTALHVVSALTLAASVAMTLLAWRAWAGSARSADAVRPVTDSDAGKVASRPRFVALMATLVGAFASLAIAAMWFPVWVLSPCH